MKSLWLTNKLDGSEDHLVSEKICTIVGEGFLVKQNNLMQNTSLTSLQQLIQIITPLKSVRRKHCIKYARVRVFTDPYSPV